jgi:hypothetical protein
MWWNLLKKNAEDHKKFQPGLSVSRLRFKAEASEI